MTNKDLSKAQTKAFFEKCKTRLLVTVIRSKGWYNITNRKLIKEVLKARNVVIA